MEHQKSHELLLSRPRQAGRHTAFDQDAEPAKEFDAQGRSSSHAARLPLFERPVDVGFLACPGRSAVRARAHLNPPDHDRGDIPWAGAPMLTDTDPTITFEPNC
jgi:hypothetical protein